MGGFGSFSYAARHPDLFVAAASFSGAVDTTPGDAPFGRLAAGEDVWGPYATQEVRYRAHNPVDLADNLRGMDLYLATGTGAPDPENPAGSTNVAGTALEEALLPLNLHLDATLTQLGISHGFETHPGNHDWYYWERDLHRWLPRLIAVLDDPAPAPSPFTYRSAEPSFQVHGWTMEMERSVREFAIIDGVTTSGLAVTGSGRANVITPASYAHGKRYLVESDDGDLQVVAADKTGRLRFVVDLGPSNRYQQYTLAADAQQLAEPKAYFRTVVITSSRIT